MPRNITVLRIRQYICKRYEDKFMAPLLGYDYHKHISDGTIKVIEKFLDALDEHTEKFFLYLDDPLVSEASNLAEQNFQ